MAKQRKLVVASVLLIVFAIIKVGMILWWQSTKKPSQQAGICNVQSEEGCALPDGTMIFFSHPIKAGAPFDITLKQVSDKAAEASVSFSMRDMDMGFNRYRLRSKGHGVWGAEQIRLPVCVQNRRDYLADIAIDNKVFQVGFSTE